MAGPLPTRPCNSLVLAGRCLSALRCSRDGRNLFAYVMARWAVTGCTRHVQDSRNTQAARGDARNGLLMFVTTTGGCASRTSWCANYQDTSGCPDLEVRCTGMETYDPILATAAVEGKVLDSTNRVGANLDGLEVKVRRGAVGCMPACFAGSVEAMRQFAVLAVIVASG